MKRRWKVLTAIIFVVIIIFLFFGKKISYAPEDNFLKNEITFTSQVDLNQKEKAEIIRSVDDFMNKYKLPKGVPNSYTLSVERRLDNAIEIVINPEQEGTDGWWLVYAEKTNDTWQVDENAGPWCTLETFVEKTCY